MAVYYDNSWSMQWNKFVLFIRRTQRKWSSKTTICVVMGILLIPTIYCLIQVETLNPCRRYIQRMEVTKPEDEDDSSPFKSRPVTHNYDISVQSPTSILWPEGCRNERRRRPYVKCSRPRSKIMFVKTHKCASSTISSAILRYALNHNLQVALPKYDLSHVGWPSPYRPYHVWGFSVAGFHDVLAHHSVYDRCYVLHDFPKPQTMYVTILRHPFQQFRSAINFFNEERVVLPRRDEAVSKFLLEPDKYERQSRLVYGRLYFGEKSLTKNMMSTELGFPASQFNNDSSVDIFIDRINKDFELVLIQEYFDESLVLLKRLMCWELKDLIYIKLNQNKNYRYRDQQEPTEDMLVRHREWSKVDYELYEFFNITFWEKVDKEGDSFHEEVNIFKQIIQEFSEFCGSRWMNGWVYPPTLFNKQFTLTKEDCRKMTMMPEHLTPTLWMASNLQLIHRADNPFNTRTLWTNQGEFDKWY